MNTIPLISIIIPIYGVEQYIERCALSILNQTYPNIEVIFVNDCTKDNSINILNDILRRYSEVNTKIIHHKTNRGLSAARNSGVKVATGEYILHIDSDDWVEPCYVEKLLNKTVATKADITICGHKIIKSSDSIVSLPLVFHDKNKMIESILLKKIPGSMWGKMISRRLYSEHDDTWSIEGINHGEDYATMPRLLYYANNISFVNEPLYNYNQENVNSYTQNITDKSIKSMLKADAVLEDFFKDRLDADTLILMKLRTKLGLVKRGNPVYYKELSKLYSDLKPSDIKQLSISDRVLLKIIGHGLDNFIAYVINKKLKK